MVSNSQLKLIESLEKNEWTTVDVFFIPLGSRKDLSSITQISDHTNPHQDSQHRIYRLVTTRQNMDFIMYDNQ